MEAINDIAASAWEFFKDFGPKLGLAIVTLIVGFWLLKRIKKVFMIPLNRANLGPGVTSFIMSILDAIMKIAIILFAASFVGFETSSLVAVIAAASFAVGLALQGSLSNFAAGILIMVFKPYRTGEWIEVKEKFGKVQEIQIFNTILETPGRKTLIIPNAQVIDDVVTNFSEKGIIRIELNVHMPYAESFPRVKKIILDAIAQCPDVLSDPAPEVGIESFDSHTVILSVRPYAQPDRYWEVTFACHEVIKAAFHEAGIKVAYSEGVELGSIGA